jgi:hypothetical protein
MADLVVTVPKSRWSDWIGEGDLPGQEAEYESHFWLPSLPRDVAVGDRLYIVAHDKLRGYAPITAWELECELNPSRACLVREGGAVAVTLPEPIRGFQGWRRRWWEREAEVPFPAWRQP